MNGQRFAEAVADRLADPAAVAAAWKGRWWPQSLAKGAAGIALLHIELARTGKRPWSRVQAWARAAASGGADASETAHLHYGAPALAYMLRTAARAGAGAWCERALEPLEEAVERLTIARIAQANSRMDEQRRPLLAEFDAIRGLAGSGSLLLSTGPEHPVLPGVLSCLVRLTEPRAGSEDGVLGWWAPVGPDGAASPDFPGGQANTGMAHGITGPLALLAAAMLKGVTVEGQAAAIERIRTWLGRWRADGSCCPWWPYWITSDQLSGDAPVQGPGRPSWCYGAAGVARALHLAAIATGDTAARAQAETDLRHVLTCPCALAMIPGASLCHGHAGLARIASAAAADTPGIGFSAAADALLARVTGPDGGEEEAAEKTLADEGIGLLDGAAGAALAVHSETATDWGAFMLIDRPRREPNR